MEQPNMERIREAAKKFGGKDPFYKELLRMLWPEAFEERLKIGQVFQFNRQQNTVAGIIVYSQQSSKLHLVSLHTGKYLLANLPEDSTMETLAYRLNTKIYGPFMLGGYALHKWSEDEYNDRLQNFV